MKKFAAVDCSTGNVAYTISPACDTDYENGMVVADGRYVMVEYPIEWPDLEVIHKMFYYNGGLAVKLESHALLTEDNVLVGLPVPCEIQINGASYQCPDPLCELDLTHVGTYKVVVKAYGYLDKEFKVTK